MAKRTFPRTIKIVVLLSAFMLACPSFVFGHSPAIQVETVADISASPNPIGVGQTANISFSVSAVSPKPPSDNAYKLKEIKVTITRPDGQTETKAGLTTNFEGQGFFLFAPALTGTYLFSLTVPTQTLFQGGMVSNGTNIFSVYVNDTFLGSTALTSLTVQNNPVPVPTPTPIPGVVGGALTSDTTWIKDGGPYTLSGSITVNQGVTLTINPGVVVNLNAHNINVDGQLVAKGTAADKISFFGGSLTVGIMVKGSANISNCVINGQVLAEGYTTFFENVITGRITVKGGSHVVCNNTVYAAGTAGGIDFFDNIAGSAIITDNAVSGAWRCIHVSDGSTAIITRNYVHDCDWGIISGGNSRGISGPGANSTVTNNTIVNNVGGMLVVGDFSPVIKQNNFHNNSEFALSTAGANADANSSYGWGTSYVDASFNWWGTTDQQAISQSIKDSRNNSPSGTVVFLPFLAEPNNQAMPNFGFLPQRLPDVSPQPTPASTIEPSPSETQLPTSNPTQTPQPTPTSTSTAKPPATASSTPTATPQYVPQENGGALQLNNTVAAIVLIGVLAIVIVVVVLGLMFLNRKRSARP